MASSKRRYQCPNKKVIKAGQTDTISTSWFFVFFKERGEDGNYDCQAHSVGT